MNPSKPNDRVMWGLILGLVVLGLSGCVTVPFDLSLEPACAPTAPARLQRKKPATKTPKPADADDDSDPFRPSRWRKKLRAKYA